MFHLTRAAGLAVLFVWPGIVSAQLLAPNGGEVWRAGEPQTIRWTPGSGSTVRILFTPVGNFQFFELEVAAPNTGEYDWLVDNFPTSNARVRIEDNQTGDFLLSDETFTVLNVRRDQSVGSLGLSADALGTPEVDATPFQEFDWFLIANIDFGLTRFELAMFAWEAFMEVPEEITVTDVTLHPEGAANIGSGVNFVVGTGECLEQADMPFTLASFSGILFADATNLHIQLGPASNSSIDPPEGPVWAGCALSSPNWPFRFTTPLTVNPTVATQRRSWGAIKSDF